MITPVISYLKEQQVSYRLLPHQTPAVSITDAARQRGIRQSQMVKSILLRDMSNRLALACAPGDRSVDPKKVRALLQWRRMTCVEQGKIISLTGYHPGTVTPLLLPSDIPIIFDPSLQLEPEVTISSGSNMAGIALSLNDLVKLCQPTFANICRDE
ncbi:aminoacyl-tRNA deacylase [Vibrio sonorensis]|uniref:aminoacyl-tRNA deacylase n=1 Tax=Vibrio sonorensis TaxID=1004316 RepID=UPI0008D92A0E|nr:YbaK/EbsC family protein [Vibrio sonorensis]